MIEMQDPTPLAGRVAIITGVAHTVTSYGRLDIMFNNAGIAAGAPLLEWTPAQYERLIAVNQHGVRSERTR